MMNFNEMIILLKTARTAEEINEHREEIAEIIPKVRIMFDYDQKNNAHQYDLWMHCLHTVVNLPRGLSDDMLYLAALLHDIGKPDSQVRGKREGDPDMHYYGHPEKSTEIVKTEVLKELKDFGVNITKEDADRLIYYVEYHDDRMKLDLKSVRRHYRLVSFPVFKNLMLLQVADAIAHVQIPVVAERVVICGKLSGEEGEKLWQRIEEGE